MMQCTKDSRILYNVLIKAYILYNVLIKAYTENAPGHASRRLCYCDLRHAESQFSEG